MRLVFLASPSLRALRNAFDPEWAMVPRFSTISLRVIPMPKSWMVNVLALSSVVTLISRGRLSSKISFSVICVWRSFSKASDALDTSSRTKISFSV